MSEFEHPLSALVAKRLAEAADGYRGKLMYFVSDFETAGELGAFEGEDERDQARKDRDAREANGNGRKFGVFGPFFTEEADAIREAGLKPEILDITVRVRLPDEQVHSETFKGDEFDALFWSRSALDKFVIPYYVTALNLEYANKLPGQFSEPNIYMLAHLPDTTPKFMKALKATQPAEKGGALKLQFTTIEP